MKQQLDNICKYINNKGRFKSNNNLILNSLFYHVSSFISLVNPVLVLNNKQLKVNYFGISIANSGSGKSFVYNTIKDMFPIDKWNQALKVSYEEANKQLPNNDFSLEIDGNNVSLDKFLPNYENTIEGTREGLYLRALALSKCFVGSLNIINEEIMDVIKDANLNMMKELYDGQLLGKVIKGSINENIYGINANMLIFGSSIGLKRDSKIYETFVKALNSGIYRRSFIYYEEPRDIVVNNDKEDININIDNILNIIKNNKDIITNGMPLVIEPSNEVLEYMELINYELIEFSNKYKEDERFSAEIGSFDKIAKLSAILAIIEGKTTIEYKHIEFAYSFYKELRNTNTKLFNVEPQHQRIYRVIKKLGKATKSEVLEQDIFNRITFNEDINLVEETCYRHNERLVVSGSKIKFYKIEPIPDTNINKIIVSIPKNDKKEKTTDYTSNVVSMFGSDKPSIERLVVSDKVSNFCLVHFDKGKRKKDNVINSINAIGIDIDYGLAINDCLKLLEEQSIVYICYTTRNHQKDKDGLVNDRYRVILPLRYEINIEPDRYPQFIENICNAIGITVYDTNALDMSRLWFTNPVGSVYKNEKGVFLDPIPFMPETKLDEQIEQVDISTDDEEIDRRINGMIRWTISNSYEGNRNMNLLKLGLFVYDLTGSKDIAENIVFSTNQLLSEPISNKEIKSTILKTIRRK